MVDNGIYIYTTADRMSSGVIRKIDNQISVFSHNYEMRRIAVLKEQTNVLKSLLWRAPFGSFGRHYDEALEEVRKLKKTKFVYIRDSIWDRRYFDFIKRLKESACDARIILEIPTYPYAHELFSDVTLMPFYFKDIYYKKFASQYIDRIVTYSDDDMIYGIPTIKTMNGIIVDEVDHHKHVFDDCIDIIAVATMQKHHGYERIIKGIRSYLADGGDRKLKLHLVGQGPQTDYYEKLVGEYGLTEYVQFWGNKSGAELEGLYGLADIGLGSLGFHLIGAEKAVSSTLKTREYLAHGLPFVSACVEDVFLKHPESMYYRKFPDDDTDISVADLIDFYDSLLKEYGNDEEMLRDTIHRFAKETIDMEAVMRPVLDYISDN